MNNNNAVSSQTQQHHQFGPKYRCAIYIENLNTNNIILSFSNDSTCTSINSYSNTNMAVQMHSEIIELYLTNDDDNKWQTHIGQSMNCRYPISLIGHWEYMQIDRLKIVYRDFSSFKTYTMKCIENDKNNSEKFVIFGRTQW